MRGHISVNFACCLLLSRFPQAVSVSETGGKCGKPGWSPDCAARPRSYPLLITHCWTIYIGRMRTMIFFEPQRVGKQTRSDGLLGTGCHRIPDVRVLRD